MKVNKTVCLDVDVVEWLRDRNASNIINDSIRELMGFKIPESKKCPKCNLLYYSDRKYCADCGFEFQNQETKPETEVK